MADSDIHNRALEAAHARAEDLVAKLAKLIAPIIAKAGREAAAGFSRKATHHMTASSDPHAADRAALDAFVASGGVPAELGQSLALRASAPAPSSTMVALLPRPSESDAINSDESLFHVTLAYLGQYDGDLSDLAATLGRVAATHAPLAGEVGGVGHFADNGKGHPAILLPSVPGLVELRVAVTDALVNGGVDYGRQYGYLPHGTMGYTDGPVSPDPAMIGNPLHFDSLWVVRGDTERVEVPLTGVRPLTAAADPERTPAQWAAPAVDEVFDMAAFVAAIRAKTDPVRQAVVKTMMSSVLDGVGLSFDVTNPFTAKALATAGQHVTSIADTTRSAIQTIIDQSYQNGLSIDHTAKAIRLGMKEASQTRAETIARTEIVGATNAGSLAAAQIVSGATGAAYSKVWMTAPGARYPRHEDYPDLDGQTTELDGFFQVGDSSMQFPGDPDGDPGESINCRCSLRYEDQGGDEVGDEVAADDE